MTNHDRGAGVNGRDAEFGFHLHLVTGSSNYDADGTVVASPSLGATNMMNWVNPYLDSNKSCAGLYWNVVRSDGSIDSNLWSDNQGVMVGTNVLRYFVTANNTYLTQAVGIANKSLSHYSNFEGQPPSFNAMPLQTSSCYNRVRAARCRRGRRQGTCWNRDISVRRTERLFAYHVHMATFLQMPPPNFGNAGLSPPKHQQDVG